MTQKRLEDAQNFMKLEGRFSKIVSFYLFNLKKKNSNFY